MVAYSPGMKVYISIQTLEKVGYEPEVYADNTVDGCVICTILRLVKGRTWLLELPDG